jgi:hypothetical protein
VFWFWRKNRFNVLIISLRIKSEEDIAKTSMASKEKGQP